MNAIDCVVGHHLNPFTSGVARFNEILAERLGVPILSLFDDEVGRFSHPLVSLKIEELDAEEARQTGAWLEGREGGSTSAFLHTFRGGDLERLLVERSTKVWCGNAAIHELVREARPDAELVWAPGLILDRREFDRADITVFSFGMAHKIRADMFARLRDLLDASGRSYELYVSSANHETATMDDAQAVFDEMKSIFERELYFLGNLSDVAVSNWLTSTTFFAAFFEGGVRANNTSVASAMEHGAVVITNLDRHSPSGLVHMESVIDINRCDRLPDDPATLEALGRRAREAAAGVGWDGLIERLASRS